MKIVFAVFVGWAMLLMNLRYGNLFFFYLIHMYTIRYIEHLTGENRIDLIHLKFYERRKIKLTTQNPNCFFLNLIWNICFPFKHLLFKILCLEQYGSG